MNIHPILQEVISFMYEIEKEIAKTPKAKVSPSELKAGIRSSSLSSRQTQEVAMTPLMRNALEHYGDIKSEGWRLKFDDPQTKAEKAIVYNMKQLLAHFNGSADVYDTTLPLRSVKHYDVQCHQNMKDNLRDIQPGQMKSREQAAVEFTRPTSNTINQVVSMIKTDPIFQKAILLVMENIPSVRADDKIREINLPFMTKHSGVGYPYWKNDRTISEDGNTYAEKTMHLAEKLQDKYTEWWRYNVSTMYGRNQRGKGRLLIAVSRVLNLLLNQIEAVEIKAYKEKSPLFIGYRDDKELKQALIKMLEYCEQNGFKCANEDYSHFDSTVGQGIIVLVGAISMYKANGSRSKRIAKMRAVFATQTQLIDGIDNDIKVLLGRIFSGFIDTNRGGGLANAIQMTTQCMRQDENYSSIVYDAPAYMLVMGDDNLHIYREAKLNRKKLASGMKTEFGGLINESKYEFGPMFLQFRLFEDPDTKNLVMAYAWPRVVRSMLFKEESKGLGPVGWTYAFYQQLFKLIEYRPAFYIAVNFIIKFDKNQLFKDTPIEELNRMLKLEDEEAIKKLNTDSQKRRYQSTMEKLFDGDPSKSRFHSDSSLLAEIQAKIREVYDPTFYQKYNLVY